MSKSKPVDKDIVPKIAEKPEIAEKPKIAEKPEMAETPEKSENVLNSFLANCISIFHYLVILFVIFAPFSNIPAILILHATFALCLMVHWWGNSNACSLTVLESYLRGLDSRTESFTHKFIAPIYEISASEWNNVVWIITIITFCISIYKLYYSHKVVNALKCYRERGDINECLSRLFEI